MVSFPHGLMCLSVECYLGISYISLYSLQFVNHGSDEGGGIAPLF